MAMERPFRATRATPRDAEHACHTLMHYGGLPTCIRSCLLWLMEATVERETGIEPA